MRPALYILCATLVLGCGDGKKKKSASNEAAAGDAGAKGTPGKGLNAPGLEPDTVVLARQVMACKWSPMGYPLRCKARKAWDSSTFINREPTLLTMLEDSRVQVRWLAALALRKYKGTHLTDKALAGKLVAAAERERANVVAPQLAAAVARIELDKTGLRPKVEAIIAKHPLTRMSGMLARFALANNPDLYDFVAKVAKTDPRKPVRRAAVAAFSNGTPDGRMADSCKLWAEIARDPDPELSGDAINYLLQAPKAACVANYDGALAALATKAEAGNIKSASVGKGIESLLGQAEVTPAQKKRALKLAVRVLANASNSPVVRTRMVELISRKHPDAAKILAAHKAEKHGMVRQAVERAVKRLESKPK
jgi:hypothetical protein